MTVHIRESTNRRGDVTAIATIVPDDYKRERKATAARVTYPCAACPHQFSLTPCDIVCGGDAVSGGTWRDAWRAK